MVAGKYPEDNAVSEALLKDAIPTNRKSGGEHNSKFVKHGVPPSWRFI